MDEHLSQDSSSRENLIFKKTAWDNISEGVVLQDINGTIIDFNPGALEVLGLSADELTGKSSLDLDWQSIKEDGSPFLGVDHPAMVCLRTGQKQMNVIMGVQRRSNELRWININSVPVFLNSEKIVSHCVTTFADITDKKKLESDRRNLEFKLSEAARLSSLGEMASGISHEINNPLAIIGAKISQLKGKLIKGTLSPSDNLKDFEIIENTVDRMAKIIRGLRTYSRDAKMDPFESANVKEILEETLSLCTERFKQNSVRVTLNCDASLNIKCCPSQISQIFINLVGNSLDAIQSIEEKWIELEGVDMGDKVRITLTDCGCGIQRAIAEKMMEPFYTTKESRKGTGLGLSISRSIAKRHNGSFYYDEQAKNTSFVLVLPKEQPFS